MSRTGFDHCSLFFPVTPPELAAWENDGFQVRNLCDSGPPIFRWTMLNCRPVRVLKNRVVFFKFSFWIPPKVMYFLLPPPIWKLKQWQLCGTVGVGLRTNIAAFKTLMTFHYIYWLVYDGILTSFFQVTFWSPKWRSLSPWRGHLKHPKRSLGRTWYIGFL